MYCLLLLFKVLLLKEQKERDRGANQIESGTKQCENSKYGRGWISTLTLALYTVYVEERVLFHSPSCDHVKLCLSCVIYMLIVLIYCCKDFFLCCYWQAVFGFSCCACFGWYVTPALVFLRNMGNFQDIQGVGLPCNFTLTVHKGEHVCVYWCVCERQRRGLMLCFDQRQGVCGSSAMQDFLISLSFSVGGNGDSIWHEDCIRCSLTHHCRWWEQTEVCIPCSGQPFCIEWQSLDEKKTTEKLYYLH